MLSNAAVTANIPAADITRARAFYADVLGLTPVAEYEDAAMLVYRTAADTVADRQIPLQPIA